MLAACGDPADDPEAPEIDQEAEVDDADDADDPDDDAEEAESEVEEPAEEPGDVDATDDPEPLDAEAGTEEREESGEAPLVSITDVRVAGHDEFDRVVFEIGGDGTAGWWLGYQDRALSQGKGEEVDVEGEVVLEVAVRNIAMPFDAPEDVEAWDGPDRLEGPEGGVILEVVEDTIFEGQQVFFLGLDEQRPFRVQRLDDPQRVVIDVVAEDG